MAPSSELGEVPLSTLTTSSTAAPSPPPLSLYPTASTGQTTYTFKWSPMPKKKERDETVLTTILRLYRAAMMGDVRSPLIHLVGPPGCGKSTSVEQAAEMLGVNLHVINVSRISPLELEGVQMPVDGNSRLHMLTATWWTQLQEGDIVLLDEFLRGFAEVYNGLLDILTSRRVGGFQLPKVFFIGASNSTVTPDKALEDRLLHLPVPDPRTSKNEKRRIIDLLIQEIGMMPSIRDALEMNDLLDEEILPTYELLDVFKRKANVSAASIKGSSVRNLIGQVRLRQVPSRALRELIQKNNRDAMAKNLYQFVILLNGHDVPDGYESRARELIGNRQLTPIQAQNLELNLELIDMEHALTEVMKEDSDDDALV